MSPHVHDKKKSLFLIGFCMQCLVCLLCAFVFFCCCCFAASFLPYLPHDIWSLICSYLNPSQIFFQVSLLSRAFYELSCSAQTWKYLRINMFQLSLMRPDNLFFSTLQVSRFFFPFSLCNIHRERSLGDNNATSRCKMRAHVTNIERSNKSIAMREEKNTQRTTGSTVDIAEW
jgi:hypothetical protein